MMVFTPWLRLESFEELGLVDRQLSLALLIKEDVFVKYRKELMLFERSLLDVFTNEQVFVDDAVVQKLLFVFLRLCECGFKNEFELLDCAHFAVLCVRINRPELLSFLTQTEELCNVLEMLQDSIPEAAEIISHLNNETAVEVEEKDKENEFIKLLDDKTYIKRDLEKILKSAQRIDDEDEEDDAETCAAFERKPVQLDPITAKLLPLYLHNPTLFSKGERKSKERLDLCTKMEMTHEQLEGWAFIFERNPHKHRIITQLQDSEVRNK